MSKVDLKLLDATADNVSFFFNVLCKGKSKDHIVFPPIRVPSSLLIASVGQGMLKKIVLHHHSLLRQLASFNFYTQEYQSFMEEVTKISQFMLEIFGCNTVYTNEYGFDDIENMQTPFSLDERGREIWLQLFAQTLSDLSFPQKNLAEFWSWVELFSLRLLNTAQLNHLPKRFYFESIKNVFESSQCH